jgi:rhamnosyl/mannosyltransferase
MMLALTIVPQRAPLVVTHHSDVIRQRVTRAALHPFERWVYHRATRIFAASQAYVTGSSLLRTFGDKLDLLPMGIDLEAFLSPSKQALAERDRLRAQAQGEPLWLSVGRLVYYKGFHIALRALRELPGTLVVAGEGPEAGRLQDLASEAGLGERVRFVGHLGPDELVGAYHAATALLFPSNARSEAYGLVQVEAMASGCPVINTFIPSSGVSWVSRDEESGLTVPRDDAPRLAAAARRLLDSPPLRARLSEGARRRATAVFDAGAMAARSLKLYAKALAISREEQVMAEQG